MSAFNFLFFAILLASQLFVASASAENCVDCSKYQDGAFLPDPQSCNKYYVCMNGRAIKRRCGRGLNFDSSTFVCNIAALVDCQGNEGRLPKPTVAPSDTTCSTTTCAPVTKTTTCAPPTPAPDCTTTTCPPPVTPPPADCTTTTCAPPVTVPPPCTTTTCASEPQPQPCPDDLSKEAKILGSLADCLTLNDGAFLSDAKHCRRFYICRNGVPRRLRCTVGQWFDPKLRSCRNRLEVTNCLANCN